MPAFGVYQRRIANTKGNRHNSTRTQKEKESIQTTPKQGDPLLFEGKNRRKDGSLVDVEVSIRMIELKDKRIAQVFTRDIAERKQYEDALLQSELKYRTLFGTSTDAIFLERVKDGQVLDCNDMACQLYGYTPDEMIGLFVSDIVPNEIAENQLPAINYQKMETEGLLLESLGKRKDGAVFPTEVSINIAAIDQEQLMVAYVRDITERKQAEQSLKAYAAELEHSNKELQDFAYIASHDLQEPLRKIQTFGNRFNTKYND